MPSDKDKSRRYKSDFADLTESKSSSSRTRDESRGHEESRKSSKSKETSEEYKERKSRDKSDRDDRKSSHKDAEYEEESRRDRDKSKSNRHKDENDDEKKSRRSHRSKDEDGENNGESREERRSHRSKDESRRHKDADEESRKDDEKKERRKHRDENKERDERENDEEKKERRKHRENRDKDREGRDEDEEKKERRKHRDKDKSEDRDERREPRHKEKESNDDYDEKKERRKHRDKEDNDDDEKKERRKHRDKEESRRKDNEDEDESRERRKHREHKEKDKDRRKYEEQNEIKTIVEENENENEYENNYEDDFDDFENDSEPEVKPVRKESHSSSKKKSYDDDPLSDEDFKSYSNNKSKSSSKYDEDYNKGRVVKANAHIQIPTDLVEVHSSKIYFNHDSKDRQKRRAYDLLKTIELDKKSFTLLDINPTEMRTVYSSHLKHEKIQTNDDVIEIETQTDEIGYVTRWTQYPPDDSKGYGAENQKYSDENSDDLFKKFRIDINFLELHTFLQKSSKVVEALLNESSSLNTKSLANLNKSNLEFSQGFTKFSVPKLLHKITKSSTVSNCCFNKDDSNYFVCSYNLPLIPNKENLPNATVLVVWNIHDIENPYKLLMCDAISTSLCYSSFLVISGNVDGSIVIWDLRESYGLHTHNMKSKSSSDSNTIRSPTYTTAGVLLNENHMSEVKSMIILQNQSKGTDSGVFMQLATLEADCKLIIWTVVELKNVDMAVFETDLGLLPGGKIKLVKSSQISLNSIVRTSIGKIQYETLTMTASSSQINDFFIATNVGQIIHISRKGGSFSTSIMKSNVSDGMLFVNCIAFHHELQDILLAGYGNGEIRLYHTNYVTPIKTWNLGCLGKKINKIQWVTNRASCFFIIDESDSLYIWDLLTDDTQPVLIKQLNDFGGICFSYTKQSELDKLNEKKHVPFLMYNNNSRDIEAHIFTSDWAKKSEKDSKKFSKLIKNYLITF